MRGSLSAAGKKLSVITGRDGPESEDGSCIVMEGAQWITFENLIVEDCWPTFIYAKNSAHISLQESSITGSTAVVFAEGENSHHFSIRGNTWIQDSSQKIWQDLSWDELHHGKYKYFNGALFASKNIKGDVEISDNTVSYAFNAIRMKADADTFQDLNGNVNIFGNHFAFIRDNVVEPEGAAHNWWIHDNNIENAHAWFSLTEARLSDFYFFANIGYNNAKPCRDGGSHCGGKIFKFEETMPFPEGPIYIFNNSWYATSAIFRGGPSRHIKHWNNAIHFERTKDRLFAEAPWHDSYTFDHDVINNPFDELLKKHQQEEHGIVAVPGFEEPTEGDFRLKPGAAAIDAGDARALGTWEPAFAGKAPDSGAYEGAKRMQGPPYRRTGKRSVPTEHIILDVGHDGSLGDRWLKCIDDRHPPSEFASLKRSRRPLQPKEREVYELIRKEFPKWNLKRSELARPFKKIAAPKDIEIVVGNRGGNDGFTYGKRTICIDLSEWVQFYGNDAAEVNRPRLHRILSHEYIHLMTKSWLQVHPFKVESFRDMVVYLLFYEGLGHYYSLSPKWIRDDGSATALAAKVLKELTPIFEQRMAKILSGSPDETLMEGMVSGTFSKKWGALPVALWLSKVTKRSPDELGKWIDKGPEGILSLAKEMGVTIETP